MKQILVILFDNMPNELSQIIRISLSSFFCLLEFRIEVLPFEPQGSQKVEAPFSHRKTNKVYSINDK